MTAVLMCLYGIQTARGEKEASDLLHRLTEGAKVSSWLPQLLIRYSLPWKPDDVVSMCRMVLLAAKSLRQTGIDEILLATIVLRETSWPRYFALDQSHQPHRALGTAIFERLLELRVEERRTEGAGEETPADRVNIAGRTSDTSRYVPLVACSSSWRHRLLKDRWPERNGTQNSMKPCQHGSECTGWGS